MQGNSPRQQALKAEDKELAAYLESKRLMGKSATKSIVNLNDIVCLFVSIPQLKGQDSSSTGWKDCVCNLSPQNIHNNNNRQLIERFQKLKALYNLKKNIHCVMPTIIQINGKHASIQNIQKFTFSYKVWQEHMHTRSHTHMCTHAYTHTALHAHTMPIKSTWTHSHTHTAEKDRGGGGLKTNLKTRARRDVIKSKRDNALHPSTVISTTSATTFWLQEF